MKLSASMIPIEEEFSGLSGCPSPKKYPSTYRSASTMKGSEETTKKAWV